MMRFIRIFTLASVAALAYIADAQAQDVHFSQFFDVPLLRNPSLAGIFTGDIRAQGVYRNQWGSVTAPYKTGSFNVEYKKPVGNADDFITTGMQLLYDKAGATNFITTNILPVVNYHKSLNGEKSQYLSLGFMGGLVQRRIDRSKMTTNHQYDANGYNPSLSDGETFLNPNYSYLDGSVGMTFNSALPSGKPGDNYYIGVAYHHLNRPKNSFYKNPDIELNPKWVLSAGVRFDMNETSYFTLQADQTNQGTYSETIGGAMYSYKIGEDYDKPDYTLHLGAFIRWKDALIPVIKLDYNPFEIALSYDVNISELKTASQGRGGTELSVSYRGFFDRGNSSRNAVLCPRF
jgi:type IX secretion system PorP/SprF family membrane protein